MDDFCTLFDLHYLSRGLVLYRSLHRVCPDSRLHVFCMDEQTEVLLTRMSLPGMHVIGQRELEKWDPALRAVKDTRSQVEYCWTATPAVCLYALEHEPELETITYLDADLFFFSDPKPLFEELGDDSVLIVPHRFSQQWAGSEETVGFYNVQYLTFRRNESALQVLRWWRERCLEWCYDRFEDGKWGDQRYLDDWPQRFAGVHVLKHLGGGLAPWNAGQHSLACRHNSLRVDGLPVVFYHCQSLKLLRRATALARLRLLPSSYRLTTEPVRLVWKIDWPISEHELEFVWETYIRHLGEALADLWRFDGRFDSGFVRPTVQDLAREVVLNTTRQLVPLRARRALRRTYRALARRTLH